MAKIECKTQARSGQSFKRGEIYQSDNGKVVMCTRNTLPNGRSFEGVLLYDGEIGEFSTEWATAYFSPWHGVMHIEA